MNSTEIKREGVLMNFVTETFAFSGIEAIRIDIQSHLANGLPAFHIVGLPDKTIAESKERVRAALSAIGFALPSKRITINLSPADLVKEGSHFDLPIAMSLLGATGVIRSDLLGDYFSLGELSLRGDILPVNGVLPAAIEAMSFNKGVICSDKNVREAAWSGNKRVLAAANLLDLVNHFAGNQYISEVNFDDFPPINIDRDHDEFLDIKGQEIAKRAILIAAAGGHNLLFFGPPGAGKSYLAKRLAMILPPMSPAEILETSKIYSISGNLKGNDLVFKRPFRSPHHTATTVAMVGGGMGKRVAPGEISLAHNGVLFLDELPEFSSSSLEALRQPMEEDRINIARANSFVTFPADFQLIAAMNPCKCGYIEDPERSCGKAPVCASNYLSKISGPFLDRIDMYVYLSNIRPGDITGAQLDRGIEAERLSVSAARRLQTERYKEKGFSTNAHLQGADLLSVVNIADEAKSQLTGAAEKLNLSVRGFNRVLRVARTIADLAGRDFIMDDHISEAISYRVYNPVSNLKSLTK